MSGQQQVWHEKDRTTPYRCVCNCTRCAETRLRVVNVYPELTNIGRQIVLGSAENA